MVGIHSQAAKAVLEQHFSAAALMLTEPNFIRVSQQGGGGPLPLVAGLATVGSRTAAGPFFHGSGNGKADDAWSSSASSDEETYKRDTVTTAASGHADEGRQSGLHKSMINRNRPLVSDCLQDPHRSGKKNDTEMKEDKDSNTGRVAAPKATVLSRDQLLDFASSELAKKAPEDLDNLDPDFAVVIMRQVGTRTFEFDWFIGNRELREYL